MCRRFLSLLFPGLLALPGLALGSVITITEFMPTGIQDGIVDINSLTAGGITYSVPDLEGAVEAETTGLNSAYARNHPRYPTVEDCLKGLDAGSAALGLGHGGAMATWFTNPVTGDGRTDTAEIFLVDWGASLDNYQVQLLTSDATAGIAGAVVAGTVQVLSSDQVQTSTIIDTEGWGAIMNLAGVGIEIDSENLDEGTQIHGVLVPADDGFGGLTGFDPTIVAVATKGPAFRLGDLNKDGFVYFQDLNIMTANWVLSDCNVSEGNLNASGIVDFIDFAMLADEWLAGAWVTITQQPADLVLYEGEMATFHVTAAGPEPITYHWQKDNLDLSDGGRISGATTDMLQIADVNSLDAGNYRCVVTNNYSTVVSNEATLTVMKHGDIGVSPSGHYVTYNGEVLMLIGDSGTQCAAQNSNLNHRAWIDDCKDRGIRAIHVWSFVPVRQKQDGSQIEDRWGYVIPDVMPWARKTSGPLAYDQRYQWDLQTFDEGPDADMTHYWPRMRDMCSYAKSKNMLVGITMFTGWSKHDYSWVFHPLNIDNGGHLTDKADAVTIASPGTEVWQEAWSDTWPSAKKTQWVWEQLSIKAIDELGSIGNVFFVFFDEHSYSEGNMGDHFLNFFRNRGQAWVDWNTRRPNVNWVMSDTLHSTDKNSNAVSGFNGSPARPYLCLEGEPYMGDGVRTAIWTFSIGGSHYFFHADAGQETVQTGIMGYDPCVPGGDKGMEKRDWLGHASRFFNEHVEDLDTLAPHNELSSSGTYCLADPGQEYVVYSRIGASTSFTVDLTDAPAKTLTCRFYNPRDGQFEPAFQRIGGSSSEPFTKLDTNDWVLHIAVLYDSAQATNPEPSHMATDVGVFADLSWTPGVGATSHDVYFGPNSPPPFVQNQVSTTFDPGTMAYLTTYFWRIDEVNSSGTTTGSEWHFTTATKGRFCFPAETTVWIDGEPVPISNVVPGQGLGGLEASLVQVFQPQVESIDEHEGIFEECYDILLETGNRVTVVSSHFFLTDSGQWTRVQNLKPNSNLQSLNGSLTVKTIATRAIPYIGKVYHLRIAGSDRYFVGEDGIVVRDH
jgi:hypothetical protein